MPATIRTKAVRNAQYNPYSSTETFDDMFYKEIVDTLSSNSLTHADSFNNKGADRLQTLRAANCPRFIEIISFSNGIWRYVNARTTNEATNQQLKWSEFLDEASPVDAVDRPWLFAYYLLTTLNIVELRDAIQAIGRNTQRVPGGARQVMDTLTLARGAGARKQTRYQSTYR
jgi:polyferredoxin